MPSPKHVLVVGLKEFSPGKTTTSCVLLRLLRERGYNVCGFKPQASHNVWYDFDAVHEGLSQGRLYGKDAKLLREASGTDFDEETISPFHWLLANPPMWVLHRHPGMHFFIVARITVWGDAPTHHLLINETLLFDHGLNMQVEQLRSSFDVVHALTSVAQARELTEGLKTEAIQSAFRRLCTRHDSFVYESFSHFALPWREIESLDSVIGVEPGFVYTFDPKEYLTAARLPKNTRGNASVGRLLKMIEPCTTTVVPPACKADIAPQLHRTLADLIPD